MCRSILQVVIFGRNSDLNLAGKIAPMQIPPGLIVGIFGKSVLYCSCASKFCQDYQYALVTGLIIGVMDFKQVFGVT